jgi:uncharacterized membrane protein YebE (DUF533 family)
MNTPDKNKTSPSSGFSQYIQKVQKEMSDDSLIEVYVSLYLWSLKADGVLNYEEKAWFSDRVKELYDVPELSSIKKSFTMEQFLEKAKAAANVPLPVLKIAEFFKKEKKVELCFELACFAVYTGDKELSAKESGYLDKLAQALEISDSQKTAIQEQFKNH